MDWVKLLPSINAGLNSMAVLCLMVGLVSIRQGRIELHRKAMLATVACSALFLTCYLIYHAQVGSVRFQGQGWSRPVYFSILLSHTILAASIALLVPVTLYRALKGQFDRHRSIARITFPIWLYVSITGVIIYFMLYHIFAPA